MLYRGGAERQPGFRHGREGAEVPRRAVYVSYARVVRSGALDLVGAHLRTRVQDTDVFQRIFPPNPKRKQSVK